MYFIWEDLEIQIMSLHATTIMNQTHNRVLTLYIPGSPYAIVQADFVMPKQPKPFERLPFWGDNFPTGEKEI